MTSALDFAHSQDLVLQVNAVGKLYARNRSATRKRLASTALRALFAVRPRQISELYAGEFWAVDGVSFELRRGEALGIIGLNGSGKTTLLRMLAGQIVPDRGDIWIKGTSAAMIDLQAGFQSPASGRENIFLRAAALGFNRTQTREKIDEIIAFSELGDAINAPLASYSAGMKMRLAFSIMITVSPDVLFIDEVLAVGDFRFRQKCLEKVRELRAKSAFVLVSHSMNDVGRFCDRVIVMHQGKPCFEGKPDDAIAFYHTLESDIAPTDASPNPVVPANVERPDVVTDVSVSWLRSDGATALEFQEGDQVKIRVTFNLMYSPNALVVGVPVYDAEGQVLTGFATDNWGQSIVAEAGDSIVVEFEINDITLVPGRYRTAIGITDGPEFLHMRELFEIIIRPKGRKSWGIAAIPYTSAYHTSPQAA